MTVKNICLCIVFWNMEVYSQGKIEVGTGMCGEGYGNRLLFFIINLLALFGFHLNVYILLLLLSHFSRVRPHRQQPTRLPRPWDSPGKNTGVGCHFLLQCMKAKSKSEVAQSCPTLSDPMDCSPPGSSIHGIFQARVLEWGAIAFSGVPITLMKI